MNAGDRRTMTPSTSTASPPARAQQRPPVASWSRRRQTCGSRARLAEPAAARTGSAAARASRGVARQRRLVDCDDAVADAQRSPAKSGDVCSSAVTVSTPRTFESLTSTTRARRRAAERRSYVRALERHDAAVRVGGLQQRIRRRDLLLRRERRAVDCANASTASSTTGSGAA